jgi:predicted PolB exonuclease-like 3'-5' exonuclease
MSYFNILFLDIETVGMKASFDELDERWQALWRKKAAYHIKSDPSKEADQYFDEKAAIYSEFGRVACISFGFLHGDEKDLQFKVKSVAGHDEKQVLRDFADFLQKYYSDLPRQKLCGHNIKEFDIPYLCRRMLRHGLTLPDAFNLFGKKPWEVKHLLDTLELWKFGDFKNYTSLELLSAHLGIPTPKDDIDGSKVHSTFYDKDDLARIVSYCEKDVVTTARVYMRMMHQLDFDPDKVEFV